jgi:mono/diheme cytochrome c family protein
LVLKLSTGDKKGSRYLFLSNKEKKTHLERRVFMRMLVWIAVVALGVAFSGTALAADGAAVYTKLCASCHGMKGEGMAMMGPAIKGNKFVLESDDAAIKDIIINGRSGDAKKYKDFPLPMVPQKLSDDDVKAVIAHMKGLAKE